MKNATIGSLLFLASCASTQMSMQPPAANSANNRVKMIPRPRDNVWNDAVAKLGQRFFVINNLDKSSGLINVSYAGDPEKYVDCGKVTVTTKGPGGGSQTFNGSVAQVTYAMAMPIPPYGFPANVPVRRQMELEGRVNLIFESPTPESTRVTAATKYILTRKFSAAGAVRIPDGTDTTSFNSNEVGNFPASPDGRILSCTSTGALEQSILDLVN